MIKSLSKTFTIEKEVENNQNHIYEMKLFNEDKLLIIEQYHFSIYDLLTDIFILRWPLVNKLIFCRTEIIGKDKIMMAVAKNTLINYVIIYQFSENRINNSYNLIILSEITLPNNVDNFFLFKTIYMKNKIIIIGDVSFYIYEYKNNNPSLLIKFKNNPYNKWTNGFKFNKEIIGLLEGNNSLIHFYNIKKGTLIQQNILCINDSNAIKYYIKICEENNLTKKTTTVKN